METGKELHTKTIFLILHQVHKGQTVRRHLEHSVKCPNAEARTACLLTPPTVYWGGNCSCRGPWPVMQKLVT